MALGGFSVCVSAVLEEVETYSRNTCQRVGLPLFGLKCMRWTASGMVTPSDPTRAPRPASLARSACRTQAVFAASESHRTRKRG